MRRDSFVYVISRVVDGQHVAPVKVGISDNPENRLSTIQTACPFKIDLAWVFEVLNREVAREIELSFHQTQKHARMYGEWFDFAPVKAIHLLCVSYRTMLEVQGVDSEIAMACLDKAGVLTAERRWSLCVPRGLH
jgi:hypothetical protein